MRFFYFVGDKEVTKPPEELAYAFADHRHAVKQILAKGPNGGRGTLILSHEDTFSVTHIDHDKQTWRKVPGTDNLYIGWMTDDPPKPAELERKQMTRGYRVQLSDGNEWQIPMAREVEGEGDNSTWLCALPTTYDMNDDGEWIGGDIMPRYQRLWDIANQVIERWLIVEDGEVSLTIGDVCGLCAEILAYNYRVSAFECACLKLLGAEVNGNILIALLDLKVKKKTASDTSNTAGGEMDSAPVTGQLMATLS